MNIRQISIFLENKRGQLSQICQTLAEAKINIVSLSLADTTDFGILRLIVDDHERACAVLTAAGYMARVTEVVAVCVSDQPGGMAGVMALLDRAGVDVEYSYAFASHRGEKAVLVFRFGDNSAGAAALAAGGLTVLDEHQVEAAAAGDRWA